MRRRSTSGSWSISCAYTRMTARSRSANATCAWTSASSARQARGARRRDRRCLLQQAVDDAVEQRDEELLLAREVPVDRRRRSRPRPRRCRRCRPRGTRARRRARRWRRAGARAGRRPRGVAATVTACQYELGEAERLLRDEVEDHLAADRRDAQQPQRGPRGRRGRTRTPCRCRRGSGSRRRGTCSAASAAAYFAMLAASPAACAVGAVVVEPRRLPRHEPRQLELDLRRRQRVRDALVRADRHVPHLALARVRGRRVRARSARCPCRSPRR